MKYNHQSIGGLSNGVLYSLGKKRDLLQFTGKLTGQDLIECNMAMYGNQRFDELHVQIIDMLEVTQFECTVDDVKKVAALDSAAGRINPNMKCALVSSEQVAHQLSKIYQKGISNSPWEGKSFQTLESARQWTSEGQ